jgi:hypothetical protein
MAAEVGRRGMIGQVPETEGLVRSPCRPLPTVAGHQDRPRVLILSGNRRADWKVAGRSVNMGKLSLGEFDAWVGGVT